MDTLPCGVIRSFFDQFRFEDGVTMLLLRFLSPRGCPLFAPLELLLFAVDVWGLGSLDMDDTLFPEDIPLSRTPEDLDGREEAAA